MDHNPPPPPELLNDFNELVPDKIGETVFSKQWLFESLIYMVQAVEKENTSENEILELDSEIEERICMLWDMSSNKDIANFFLENRAIEIFLEIINMTVSPRLVEIIVGILGNIASFGNICEHITKNDKLIEQVIQLVGSTDPPILVQVIRLIHVCVMNETSSLEWINSIKKNKDFIQHLIFILKSSLNGELLKGTLKLIYCLLDKEEMFSKEWNLQEVIGVVVESGKQLLNLNDYKALDEFWHSLYFLVRQENTNINLEENFNSVYQIFKPYVLKQRENENYLPHPNSFTAVAAALSVVIYFCNEKHSLIEDLNLNYVKEMLETVKNVIDKKERLQQNEAATKLDLNDESEDAQDLKHLYILRDSLKDLCDLTKRST